jgi:hypothetical protein
MLVRISDLCRSIQEERDPKKFTALIEELMRVLDEERAIKKRPTGSLDNPGVRQARSQSKQ